jgi:hypothetical protein
MVGGFGWLHPSRQGLGWCLPAERPLAGSHLVRIAPKLKMSARIRSLARRLLSAVTSVPG